MKQKASKPINKCLEIKEDKIMLRPMNVLQDGFFGDLFDDYFRDYVPAKKPAMSFVPMKTDIKDAGDAFEFEMDIPGYKKEDITAELKEGYLIVTAAKNTEKEDKSENGKYIRKERFMGTYRRSFYVGKKVTEADIKATFADGILKLAVPKENTIEREEEKKLIAID